MKSPLQPAALLKQLQHLTRHHVEAQQPQPLGALGVFHCHHPQSLRSVPLHHPALILVLNGVKRVQFSASSINCMAGELLLLPGHFELEMQNIPDPAAGDYLALFVSFSPATISRFLQGVGSAVEWSAQSTALHVPAPPDILLSLCQRIEWSLTGQPDSLLLELRQQELLALCAQHQLLGNLLRNKHPSLLQQVVALLEMDCGRDWKMADACEALGLSESSLRRELKREGAGFRDLLEQIRLTAGLALLQETRWTIAEVAAQVGYESPSRFAARFRARFGLTPLALKSSRERLAESGAHLAEYGAS